VLKLFGVYSSDCIQCICHFVGLPNLSLLTESRRLKFVDGLLNNNQSADLFLVDLIDFILLYISLCLLYFISVCVHVCVCYAAL